MKEFNKFYKKLGNCDLSFKTYSLKPIRLNDRNLIMQWRNEQLFHLRQKTPLTIIEQDKYFDTVVRKSFLEEEPDQLLFTFFHNDIMVGYGGLVHIDWLKKSAEISFLIATEKNEIYFKQFWSAFLKLLEKIAFDILKLNCIYTYSFELRPQLYEVLKSNHFTLKKRIKDETLNKHILVDSLIHTKWREELKVRVATKKDKRLIFDWINDSITRENSINKAEISWEEHSLWFDKKIKNKDSQIFIFFTTDNIGMIRVDKNELVSNISYNVNPFYRGQGYGGRMINWLISQSQFKNLTAEVMSGNLASHKIFLNNDFQINKQFKKDGILITKYIK